MRNIFGHRDEVTRVWRRLYNEDIFALYPSPNTIWVIEARKMRWAGHVVHMGDRRGTFRDLVGRPEGRRPLGRTRHR